MTTEGQNRLPEIVQYLRDNPTPVVRPVDGSQPPIVIHYHQAPAPPPPPPAKPTVAEQMIPWLYFALMACIIGTICVAILATFAIILLCVLAGLAVVIALLAYLVRSMNEGTAVKALARDRGKRTR